MVRKVFCCDLRLCADEYTDLCFAAFAAMKWDARAIARASIKTRDMCVGFDTGAGKALLAGTFPAWDVSARRAVRPFHLNLYGSGERAFRNGSEGLLLCAYPERRAGACASARWRKYAARSARVAGRIRF